MSLCAWIPACFLMFTIVHSEVTSEKVYLPGDIMLGGLFPFHSSMVRTDDTLKSGPIKERCESFNVEVFQWAEAMIFAVEEINNRKDILPNITLGYDIRDTCDSVSQAMDKALDFVLMTVRNDSMAVKAVIGAGMSSVTMPVASTLGVLNIPLVGYASTSPLLSNKSRYKSFYRTIPSDELQAKAMAEIVEHFGWNAVGTLATDDDYGRYGIEQFEREAEVRNICVAFSELIRNQASHMEVKEVVNRIRENPEIRVIVTFIHDTDMEAIVQELDVQNVTDRLWIACESWGDSKEVLRQAPTVVDGTIGVLLMEGKIPNFAQHLLKLRPTKKAVKKNPFLAQMWESAFHCSLESQGYMHGSGLSEYVDEVQYNTVVCSHDGNIRNTPVYGNADFRVSYNVYLAVYSIATALNNIIKCVDGAGLLARGRCPDIRKLQPWQLLLYVSNVTFQGTDGHHFNFGKNGDGLGVYHLVNWQLNEDREIKVVPVGHYDNRIQNGSKLRLEDTVIIWNELSRSIPTSECAVPCRPGSRQAVLDGQPKCCHECVPCADGEITNETDLPVCITCPHGFWSNGNHTECMEKIQDYLSWQETSGIVAVCSAILGTLLTVITLMIFATNRYTPIVKAANRELCIMMLVFLSVCFVSCIAFVGRPNELQCKMQIIQGVFHTSCVSIILVKTHRILTIFGSKLPAALQERRFARLQLQLLLLSFLVAIHVALVIALLALSPPGVEMNDDISKTVMYIHCKPSNIIFSLSTSMYTWLVSGICLILAFKSRKLPDNFNEAKFITFAMVLYFIVWSFYYPSSILTYGKLRALFRCLVNIVSAAALLVSIFLPKCYIILCKRELNTKAAIQRVTRQHSMKVTSRALELTPTKRSYSMGSAELNHLNPKERQLSSAEILV